MDTMEAKRLFDRLIKELEKSEMYNILTTTTEENRQRDFRVLEQKVKGYREQLDKLLVNGSNDIKKTGAGIREEDLQGEPV